MHAPPRRRRQRHDGEDLEDRHRHEDDDGESGARQCARGDRGCADEDRGDRGGARRRRYDGGRGRLGAGAADDGASQGLVGGVDARPAGLGGAEGLQDVEGTEVIH